jgi:hypothetical protein
LRPGTSILLISGQEKKEAKAKQRLNFRQKPFFPPDLFAGLKELLPQL